MPQIATSPASETAAGGSPILSRAMFVTVGVLLGLAALLTLGTALHHTSRPFDGQQAWISAHVGVMARNFAQLGVIATKGVPQQNNPIPGVEPDVYIHFPPLLPMVLGEIFRLAGPTEQAARMFMLLVLLGTATAIGALANECCGKKAAMFAVFTWLTMPVVVLFSKELIHQNLAMMFLVLAVLGYVKATKQSSMDRRWAMLSLVCWSLAALSSWEPVLAAPVLLLVGVLHGGRDERRLAWLSTLVVGISVAAVLALFLFAYPANASQLWETIRYRLGLAYAPPSHVPFHALAEQRWFRALPQPDWSTKLAFLRQRFAGLIGPVPLVALAIAALWIWKDRTAQASRVRFLAIVGLMSSAVVWYCVMTNYTFQHNMDFLIWAPAFAFAASLAFAALEQTFSKSPKYGLIAVLVIAVCGIWMLRAPFWDMENHYLAPEKPSWTVAYGHDIDRLTEPNAVVLTPEPSMMPVFYSHRHLILFVEDDATLAQVLPQMRGVFVGSPVYLAIPRQQLQSFPAAQRVFPVAGSAGSLVLLKLGRG